MTIFKKLPLMAFGLGLGFITIMGMSSFKTQPTATNYFFNTLTSKWEPLDQELIEGIDYHCVTHPTLKCTAEIVIYTEENPEGLPSGIIRDGEFELQ